MQPEIGELIVKIPSFKNAIVYKATLPSQEPLAKHLEEMPYSPVAETEFSRSSFVPHPVTAELVTPITGGFMFVVRVDQKIIPTDVINEEVNKRVSAIEERQEAKLTKDEKASIEDNVTVDLCRQAFVKSTLVLVLYHEESKLLFVNTSSKKLASLTCSMLVRVVGSIKTETIHISDIKNGLTTRLKNHLSGDEDAFSEFAIGNYIRLSRLADGKEVITYSADLASVSEEVTDSLNTGFIVESMELSLNEASFLLTDKFHFKQISTDSEYSPRDEDDKAGAYRNAASADLFFMTKAVESLCSLLEYKEPEETSE
nr:recombination-associated protein RdgC [Rosenbergiella nectarea]